MTQAVFTGTFASNSSPRRLEQRPQGIKWPAASGQVTTVNGALSVGDNLESNGGVATLSFEIDNTAGTGTVRLARYLRGVRKATLASVAPGETATASGVIDEGGEEIHFEAV